jgi:AraC-like DNA-binding protein
MRLSVSLTDAPHQVGETEPPSPRATVVDRGELPSGRPQRLAQPQRCRAPILVAWIEPQSEMGTRLSRAYHSEQRHAVLDADLHRAAAEDRLTRALTERWGPEQMAPVEARLRGALTSRLASSSRVSHPAVDDAVAHITDNLHDSISARDIAREIGLSESRFRHIFTEQMGLPLRSYIRWQRVFGAPGLILNDGSTVTDAAAAMGFSDASHLTRVMKEFLALSPSGCANRDFVDLEIVDCMDRGAAALRAPSP